ncbi:hypothetical protein [Nakamurella multipartita]|uniref:Uncharacterized protein n=1 Tax=Nakamurella multipartita (strain ATCC 700099 / DSM 44233 / CIP 104796 / JCM 9543 / NBRC 105858 / Y-104) TaxID=479431 RepID=C8XI81_NAKMY|nr:hypothetical protein [Nakamurella multipartita]ACV78450.1 hypothetical protein Namu_2070 [Nakamurella multipartita DSM 44233]
MTIVVIVCLLLVVVGIWSLGWWHYAPTRDELRIERSRQRVARIRQRTLADMERVRELGWIERDARAREQLRRLMDKYEL